MKEILNIKRKQKSRMKKVKRSLCDILGAEYCAAATAVSIYTMDLKQKDAAKTSTLKVPFLDRTELCKL